MNALQGRHIVDGGTTAGQKTAIERQLRHAEPASGGNGSGTLFHNLAPLDDVGDERMLFKLNEGVTYIQMRVLIGEPHQITDGQALRPHVVNEASPGQIEVQRVA